MRQMLILWALTSALLILAVLLLRAVLGRRMGAGLKYALWGVVLLRLLAPVQLFTVSVPVPELNAPQAMETPRPGAAPAPGQIAGVPAIAGPLPGDTVVNVTTLPGPAASEAAPMDVPKLLGWLWLAGSVVTAAAFLASNVSFARRLRRVRQDLKGTDCELPVYIAENLPSPCLFGVPRPAVYVTPEAAADPDILRHVLAHEHTHFRHGDHIWNVLRGAALALHWWNPLVWLAAALSRRDCELACDEGALKRLGEGERFAYGRTLLALIGAKPRPVDLLSCATTMTGDGKSVAQRVKRIAQAPKRWLWAAVAAVLLAVLVTVFAFGGREKVPDLWSNGVVARTYTRDQGGFGGAFTVRLNKDGSFEYYEGFLSSFIGRGTWTQEGDVICLADERNEAKPMYHYFILEEDALVFRAEGSSDFMYVDVADGERFSLTYSGPEPAEGPDAAQADSPAPTPEQAVPMEFSFSLNEGAGGVDITGLDCESAFWYAESMSGWVVAGRRDLMDAETLGSLTVMEPRFLGEAFAAGSGRLLSVCYPAEGPLLFFGLDEHANGPEKPATASVYAFVDLTAGTVQEKGVSGFGDRAEAFTDELLVDTARTLAGLIQEAAEYHDQAAEIQKALEAAQAELEERREAAVMASSGQGQLMDREQLAALQSSVTLSGEAARYYEADSLPLFEIAFSRLDKAAQSGWLNQLYSDGDHAFFSAAVRRADPSLLAGLAERAYADGEIAFFSIFADRMGEGELRTWLDRALADDKWNFQSMLFDRLDMDMDKEKDAKEEEWARQQMAEYQAVGVTMDGKNYYYQGQLVNIFLDIRANGSFYTLDTNPAGAVNIKILRDGANNITGVTYMTEAEAAELLGDMRDG